MTGKIYRLLNLLVVNSGTIPCMFVYAFTESGITVSICSHCREIVGFTTSATEVEELHAAEAAHVERFDLPEPDVA